jgi:hypothetical protein
MLACPVEAGYPEMPDAKLPHFAKCHRAAAGLVDFGRCWSVGERWGSDRDQPLGWGVAKSKTHATTPIGGCLAIDQR